MINSKRAIVQAVILVFLIVGTGLLLALAAPTGLLGWIESGSATAQVQTDAPPTAEVKSDRRDEKFVRSTKKLENKYIVVLDDEAAGPRGENSRAGIVAGDLARTYGGQVARIYRHALNGFAVELSEEDAVRLSEDPRVEYVEEDSEGWASTVQPNATWGLDRIDQRDQPLDTLYNYSHTGDGIRAYILDTGIRTTHVDFGGRASSGFDAIGGTGSGTDCNGHGTHVAGTVGGTTWGVAKEVSLISVRVLGCTGFGSASSFIAGVDWVTQNAIRPAVVNMSLGTVEADALNAAVNNSINSGLTYVVAAGNETQNACNIAPASAPAAITVSASNLGDQKAGFANYGICVDIFAPGEGITSAWNTSDTDTNVQSGTSMAAPHVSGAAALYLQANPGATPAQVRAFLYSETTKGIINASNSPTNHLLYTNWAVTPLLPPNAPPTASFVHSCDGLICTFDGSASSDTDGTIAAHAWDFGDGQIGYGANVTHTYASFSAFFSVKLEVLDDDGDRSSPRVANGNTLLGTNIPISEQFGQARVIFSQVTATGHTRIDPFFFAPNPHGNTLCDSCSKFSVTTGAAFTGPVTACIDVPGPIDDQTFNSMSLLRYTNFDDPPVNITTERITNQDGTREVCGQSTTLGTYVIATQLAGPPPQAPPTLSNTAITSPVVENGIATLTGNISDPNAGDTFTLTVNWGDGSAPQTFNYAAGTTAFSETHQYLDNPAGQPNGGLIPVNMSLADSAGGSTNWALNVTVNNVAPSLSNITATPSTILAGESTTLSGTISDPGTLDSMELTIDWRDGAASTVLNLPAGSTSFSAQHQYTTSGTYNLIIVARDKDFSATVSNPAVTVTVTNTPPPDLNGMSVTTPISENGTATLSGNISSQAQNATFTLEINWGDGSQPQTFNYQAGTTSFSEAHQYLDNGNYPINMTLTDSAGGTDTGFANVTVENVVPALSNVLISPTTIVTGGSANLTGNIADPGSIDTLTVTIAWGDGSQNTTLDLNAGATSFNSSHVYSQASAFDVSVTATDKDGGQSTSVTLINVVAPPPTPTPTPTPPRVPNVPFNEIGLNGSAFAGLTPGPNGRLYGVTYDGPVSDNEPNDPKLDQGTIYSVDKNLTNRIDHYIFIDQTDGNTPYNELTWVPAEGKFFGATNYGGVEGSGKIFTFDPATNAFATMPGGFTGSVWGSLVLANGYLYGTVQSFPQECIFRLRPSDFAVSFIQCVNWGASLQGVTFGDDGWLYGNSLYSGINCDPTAPGRGCGEIFKVRPWNDGETFDPQYQVIFQFQFYGGRDYPCPPLDNFCVRFPHTENYPIRQLQYGSDGQLYGTSFYSVFRLDPHAADVTGSFKTLWNEGGGIQATVIEGVDGRLYFTDYGGGTEGVGRVLSMDKNGGGVFELRNFTLLSGSTANGPNGRLYQDPTSKRIYGTTEYTNLASPWPGTAFVIDVPPAEYRLSGSPDGTQPIVVDDALDIFVNDALMYTDGIAASGNRGPIEIPEGYLDPGDVIRFEVRDTYGICTSLSPIYLVDNFGTSVQAHPGFNLGCGRPAGDNGISDITSFTVPGTANTAPTISNFSVTGTVSEGGVAALSFLISDPDAADTLTVRVNWGDGSSPEEYSMTASANIPINLSHTYLDDNPSGTGSDLYLLTVTVLDGLAIDSESRSITVNNLVPFITNLSAVPSPATAGVSTTLTGTFGDPGTQDTFTIMIDWGDGDPPMQLNRPAGATSFSAAHTYAGPGNFDITASVVDDDGGPAANLVPIVVVSAVPIPDAPTNLVATGVSASQIDLSWSDNSGNEDGFRIVRCNNKRCANPTLIATVGPGVTNYGHTGLTPKTTYIYRVFAFNSAGESPPSNDATGKTLRK